MGDHLHILTSLHPTVSLADLVEDIRLARRGGSRKNRCSECSRIGRMGMPPLPTPRRRFSR
ncbi:MAG TPA: hypothetical protein VKM93_04735 [Terriglobia bacterium]|nr:hypothetical protein [Terriglobia bacterium]